MKQSSLILVGPFHGDPMPLTSSNTANREPDKALLTRLGQARRYLQERIIKSSTMLEYHREGSKLYLPATILKKKVARIIQNQA